MIPIRMVVTCDCGWSGDYKQLDWFPFDPIDEFIGIDKRDNPDNIINFRKVCPECYESEYLKEKY